MSNAERIKQLQREDEVRAEFERHAPAPRHFALYEHGGTVGMAMYRDLAPDALVELMRALPPVDHNIAYSEGGTRRTVDASEPIPEGARNVHHGDGYVIQVQAYGPTTPTEVAVHWHTIVGGQRYLVRASARRIDEHPAIQRRLIDFQGDFVRYEGPAILRWPDGREPDAIDIASYWTPPTSRGTFHLMGQAMALVEAWAASADARDRETQAAFERAMDALPPLTAPDPTPADEAAYAGETLRAGTLRQYAALRAPAVQADQEVARNHWPAYVAYHGLVRTGDHFEHYSWACSVLGRLGLLTDDGYRYGSSWL